MPTSKQRREAERRRFQRQLQRRAQREVRRRRMLAVVSVIGVLAVVALVVGFIVMTGEDDKKPSAGGGSQSASATPSATAPTASASASASAYPCTWKKGGTAARAVKVPSTTKPPRTGTVDVSVRTSQGAMTFTLDRSEAPCAVASFLSLARQHYFDGTSCHRLTDGSLSVLQCGDPTGTGSGGPGYSFGDELTGTEKYTRGVLAMANAGKNTNGSQFFIVYKDSQLNPDYTVFGKVSKGLGVVDKVAAKGANPAHDGKPKLPITLTTVAAEK